MNKTNSLLSWDLQSSEEVDNKQTENEIYSRSSGGECEEENRSMVRT